MGRGSVRCVSVDPVLSGCVVYMGGVQLKKTIEVPYTTKVNYRKHTSRGTTLTLFSRHGARRPTLAD
jgi:hypothetical protein